MICSQNLARMLSICYNNRYKRRLFYSDRGKTLARWKQACDFRQYLLVRLFTHTTEFGSQWHLCLGKWRGWFTLCNVESALFGLTLLQLHRTDVKYEVLWPHSCSLTSITSTLIYEPASTWACSSHWILLSTPWATTEVIGLGSPVSLVDHTLEKTEISRTQWMLKNFIPLQTFAKGGGTCRKKRCVGYTQQR